MAGVAVSGLDILARQRSRSAAGSVCFKTSAMRTLRRNAAPDRDHRQQWSSPCESPAAITGAGQSCHEISGQRMMRMNTQPASGWASALRVNLATTPTTIFKTRIKLCRIAVRANHEKCEQITTSRRQNYAITTTFGDQQMRVRSFNPAFARFTEHCQLKTDDLQRTCRLRFPYGTDRCNTTGLLEQMP